MASIRPLSSELQKKARVELNEIEDRIPEDILHIRNWLEKQPHLTARTDDQWIVTFLRGCKYSMEKTKLKLDSYYSFRTSAPEFYKDRYPFSTAINDILKSSSFMILDESTESAKPALCLLQFDMWKYENCTLIDAIKFWLMILDVFFKEHDNMVVSGVNVILDYSHFQHYALQCTPMLIKKVVLLMQKAYPIRIEGVYIVNAPTIFESFYSIAKIFMSRKLKSRIYFYSLDDLYDKFQKRMLPKEYGGENSTIEKLADDQYLLSFLRGCKFNLQKTKQKLDFFYAMRTVVPEFFAKRDPFSQDVKQIFKMGAVSMLLQSPDSIEAPFFFLRWKYCDIETMTLSSILKATLISMDIAMIEDDNVIISGVRYIVDFTNFPVKYALQFIPSIVKKFVLCVENAYPIRIKAVYVVNAPAIFDTVYSVFKPFLSKKLKNRMHIYKEGEINKFHEEISSNILPKEYGGNQSSFSNIADPWIRKVESYREWLLEDDKYRSNERLRPESSKEFIYDTLNMEGSFRKLNID